MDEMNKSEVARIKAQIAAEQESAQRALYGSAYGTAKHEFITRRMERMGALHEALKAITGKEEADQILRDAMEGK
jgi:hypothetical protein